MHNTFQTDYIFHHGMEIRWKKLTFRPMFLITVFTHRMLAEYCSFFRLSVSRDFARCPVLSAKKLPASQSKQGANDYLSLSPQ